MDYNSNNSPNDFLWSLLANPADDAGAYTYNVHRLVNDFPQSGILQALLAHTSEQKNLKRASAYFSPRTLFKLINAPSSFTDVPDERMFVQPGITVHGGYRQKEPSVYEESDNNYLSQEPVTDQNAPVEVDERHLSHHDVDELVVDPNAEGYLSNATVTDEEHVNHHDVDELVVDPNAEGYLNDETVSDEGEVHHGIDELVVDHNAEEYIAHPDAEEHGTQSLTGEVDISEMEHHAVHEAEPLEDETTRHTEHHIEHEAEAAAEQASEHIGPNAEYEFMPAPDAVIEDFEPHVNGPLTAEEHSETEAHDYIADEEAERHEDFASPEVARREEAEVPAHEHEAIHIETEEHKEAPFEFVHTHEEAVHFDHGHVEEVDQHEAAHEVEAFAESELPEQTIDYEEEQDRPTPFIELAEEELPAIAFGNTC